MANSRSSEVIIIGAGIIGACVAHALSEMGARVILLEAGGPGRGTSAASFAWVNAFDKPPEAYHRLNAAAFAAYASLRDRLGPECGVHLEGALHWAETEEERAELRARADQLRAWDYSVEWVTPELVIQELAPELRLDPAGAREVLYAPAEGWIDAPLLIGRLLEQVRRRGGQVRAGARVREVRGRTGGAEVRIESGECFSAAAVVNCAGPDADRVAASAGLRLPLTRVPGLLLATDRVPVGLRPVVRAPGLSIRPDGGGRVVILAEHLAHGVEAAHGSGLMAQGSDKDGSTGAVQSEPCTVSCPSLPPPPEASTVLSAAARYLPALATARVEAARLGVRPMPPDGFPVVGPHPGMPAFYVVVTHSGITLGPVLGPLVAGELLNGRPEPVLSPYRPDRLLG
jgi:glycine/D-amino acid oxidase-like deaminating enzyme